MRSHAETPVMSTDYCFQISRQLRILFSLAGLLYDVFWGNWYRGVSLIVISFIAGFRIRTLFGRPGGILIEVILLFRNDLFLTFAIGSSPAFNWLAPLIIQTIPLVLSSLQTVSVIHLVQQTESETPFVSLKLVWIHTNYDITCFSSNSSER